MKIFYSLLILLLSSNCFGQMYNGCFFKSIESLFNDNSIVSADKVLDMCLRKEKNFSYYNDNFIGGIDQKSASFTRNDILVFTRADTSIINQTIQLLLGKRNFIGEIINESTFAFTDTIQRKVVVIQYNLEPYCTLFINSYFELKFSAKNAPSKPITNGNSINFEEYINATSRYTEYSSLDTNLTKPYLKLKIKLKEQASKSIFGRKYMKIFNAEPLFISGESNWKKYLDASFGRLVAFHKIDDEKIKKVIVQFTIEKNGIVQAVKILEPQSLDSNAIKEIEEIFFSTKWFPAIKNYEPSRHTLTQSIKL
jgi:hypothetical protein